MKCPKCNLNTIKYGFRNIEQRYYCKECNYYFTKRTKTRFTSTQKQSVFTELLSGTDRKEVARKYNISLRTIQRWITEETK